MISIGRIPRIAAALAALGANVAIAASLASLAQHYDAQAPRVAAFATAQAAPAQCRPERAARG
jgi:hypothetical protein